MKLKANKHTKKVGKSRQEQKYELIPYIDYLEEPRKIKAAQILAYSGYIRGNKGANGAVTLAAKEAGVNRNTIYNWLEDDKFQRAIVESRHELCAVAVRNLHKMADKGNPAVCMFLAQQLAPDIFSQQAKKHEQEKELLKLKANLGLDEELAPPTIIVEYSTEKSRDYERNKLED